MKWIVTYKDGKELGGIPTCKINCFYWHRKTYLKTHKQMAIVISRERTKIVVVKEGKL